MSVFEETDDIDNDEDDVLSLEDDSLNEDEYGRKLALPTDLLAISGLGEVKFYEAYLVSMVANQMISESLSGGVFDKPLNETFLEKINTELLNKNALVSRIGAKERQLIITHMQSASKSALSKTSTPKYIAGSKNEVVAFIREIGESIVNSFKVLSNALVPRNGDDNNMMRHVLIQVKNDSVMWLFDVYEDNVSYSSIKTYINGVENPVLKNDFIIKTTSFFKFLAVHKAREVLELSNKQDTHQTDAFYSDSEVLT